MNCAGVNSATPYFEIPDDEWDRILSINLKSTHIGCQVFGKHMADAEEGGSIPYPVAWDTPALSV